MGDCVSINKLCCPNDKGTLLSEYTSPKNICLKFDLTPLVINKIPLENKLNDSGLINESPEIKPRGLLRKNSLNIPPTKKSFLARARERGRKSTLVPCMLNENQEYFTSKQRSFTYNDEELESMNKYQSRISIDSPCKNPGDYDNIELY